VVGSLASMEDILVVDAPMEVDIDVVDKHPTLVVDDLDSLEVDT